MRISKQLLTLAVVLALGIGVGIGWFASYSGNRSASADGSNNSSDKNRNLAARVISDPVVVDPKAKSIKLVHWKINDTKEDTYACPDGYLPQFPNVIFPGSGTKNDPFYLRYVVNGLARNGAPFKPNPAIGGPLIEDYVNTTGTAMVMLPDDRIGKNPRFTHHDDNDYISVDYSQFTNDILPRYFYYPANLPIKDYLDHDPYLKEADVIGRKLRKRPYDNNPSLVDICAAPHKDGSAGN